MGSGAGGAGTSEALRGAIERVREAAGSPTASVAVVTPSTGNSVLAMRLLASTGAFVRVRFVTPEQLASELGRVRLLSATPASPAARSACAPVAGSPGGVLRTRGPLQPSGRTPEPAGWLSATLIAALPDLASGGALGRHGRALLEPGWIPALARTIAALEDGGARPADLRSCAASFADPERVLLLATLLETVGAARERDRIHGAAEIHRAALDAVRDAQPLPANRIEAAVVLGDRTLSPSVFDFLSAWLAARPNARLVLHPLEAVAPAPFGLREAALAASEIRRTKLEIEAQPIGAPALSRIKTALFRPAPPKTAGAAAERDHGGVVFLSAPDEVREMAAVVRRVQRAIHDGVALDRVAIALPDNQHADVLATNLEKAGIPATWLTGPSLARTQPARVLRLAFEIAGGEETPRCWYELLRQPGLRVRAKLAVTHTGRWRRLLGELGGLKGTQAIASALEKSASSLPEGPDRAARLSLVRALGALSSALARAPKSGSLGAHGAAWRTFLEEWLVPSPDRSRVIRLLDAWGSAAGGPHLAIDKAREVLEDALSSTEVLEGDLTEPKIRVLPPMALLGDAFDRVFVAGLSEKRFPRGPQEDPLLTDALIDHLRRNAAARLIDSEETRHIERRRLAAAATSCDGVLTLSWPETELMSGRALTPGSLLLDAATAVLGWRASYADLRAIAVRAGSRGRPVPADPSEAIGAAEHLIARLQLKPAESLPHLATHAIARRLLQLQRSIDETLRRLDAAPEALEDALDAWTGRVDPELLPNAAAGHQADAAYWLALAVLDPGAYFFRRMLRAWRPRSIDPSRPWIDPWAFDAALRASLERALEESAAGERPLDRFEALWSEHIAAQGAAESEPAAVAIARELAIERAETFFAQLPDLHPIDRCACEEPMRLAADLPWTIAPLEVPLHSDGVLLFERGLPKKPDLAKPAILARTLEALALRASGRKIDTILGVTPDGTRSEWPLEPLVDEARERVIAAHDRARRGVFPRPEGDSPFLLEREHRRRRSPDPAADAGTEAADARTEEEGS